MRIVTADDPGAVLAAAEALQAGRPVVLPTDTVYGLAALPTIAGATSSLFALKDRAESTPLAVLVGSMNQARAVAAPLPLAATAIVERYWPGPLTIVVERHAGLDWELGGTGATIGVRCPAHPFVLALTALIGPIATTSANRHGEATPPTASDAAHTLVGEVPLVVDGGECAGIASTVLDLTGEHPRLLRDGPIGTDVLAELAAVDPRRREEPAPDPRES